MAFEDDPPAQIAQMRSNLANCAQTSPDHRALLSATVDIALAGVADDAAAKEHVREVQRLVRNRVSAEAWYFLGGAKPELAGQVLYSTQAETRVEHNCVRQLEKMHPALMPSEVLNTARQLVADLVDDAGLVVAKANFGTLPLHEPGTPVWLADPTSGDPAAEANTELLPARLGLAPNAEPTRYILFQIRTLQCFSPRFADSGGYPYWRPGGTTKPIEQCPDGYSGFTEVIADGVTVSTLHQAAQRYDRRL